MNILSLVRPDLQQFSGYLSARKQNSGGDIWLNANESAYTQEFDTQQLNRYPEPQPSLLKQALCAYYETASENLLITRGSDEGIDLLIRALCIPGKDRIAIQSPTFGMYAVCARLHMCEVVDIPLEIQADCFEWNIELLIEQVLAQNCKILFICSPANPTGQQLARAKIQRLLEALQDQCVVVIDEAYGEYSQQASALEHLQHFSNLVILRTLSKAHAMAGARIGCVIANPVLLQVLKACQAPYPISKPSAELAVLAFSESALKRTQQQIVEVIAQRQWLIEKISVLANVLCVYKTDANFILVKFKNSDAIYQTLLQNGILIRNMSQYPAIQDCLRISVGTPDENLRLIQILETSITP
ncbi:MAG TPA: histidinol-phosphate transaminase [Arenimonas sp.]|nr:histidinol-phosphate transaminase [Arenimonas sp.]